LPTLRVPLSFGVREMYGWWIQPLALRCEEMLPSRLPTIGG